VVIPISPFGFTTSGASTFEAPSLIVSDGFGSDVYAGCLVRAGVPPPGNKTRFRSVSRESLFVERTPDKQLDISTTKKPVCGLKRFKMRSQEVDCFD
jgi:hypothetical protein